MAGSIPASNLLELVEVSSYGIGKTQNQGEQK